MKKVFCKDCKFMQKSEITWPICTKDRGDYVTGKLIFCMDKNKNGDCEDFESKKVKE